MFAFGICIMASRYRTTSGEYAASFEKVVDNQREVILINLPKSSQQTSMESEEQSLRSSKDASASSWT